ncbi:MAG: hypothetical protein ACK4FV_07490 [Candidatus Nitrosocaldus sp.]
MLSNKELKKKLLDMLEEDKEFRYAVAGAIGYKELLDRIIALEAGMNKRFLELEERMDERFLELEARMEERFAKVEEEIRDLRRDMQEGFRRHDEEFKRHWESIENLRRDMQEGFKHMDKRLRYIESFMNNISISIEDEARDMVEYWLKQKGITLRIRNLVLEDIEVDIYAKNRDYCIIGEAKTRAVKKAILQVDKDIARLCKKHPEYLKEKIVKVVYAMQVMPDAVEEAKKRDIWLVTGKGELTEFKVTPTSSRE